MNYKEFVNNLFNQIVRSYDYNCREQAQMSAAYDAYIGARASYSFEHERDRGHTWDIGENEVKLPDMSECQSYASKELAPYLPLIKEAFDKNLDIKDIDTLFYYIEDFNYGQKTVSCALSSEKNGVLNISYMGEPSSYDFNDRYSGEEDKYKGTANELLYKGNKFLHDVNTKDVYVRVWSAFSYVNGKLIKLGENVLDAQTFISEYPVNELNKQINEIYLRDNISHEKSELYFFKDKEVDDSYIFSKKELEVIHKGFELDPDELSAKYRTMYSAKEHPDWGYSYDVAFAELNAFVEGRELYKVSFLVPCDFHDGMTQEILGHIDGSLKVVDESNNGYVIVECLYNSLSDVAYADLNEHKTYYLDSYFTAKNNEGEMVYCGHTFGPIKEECHITDVTKEMRSKVM